jgi:hypothetical protein
MFSSTARFFFLFSTCFFSPQTVSVVTFMSAFSELDDTAY